MNILFAISEAITSVIHDLNGVHEMERIQEQVRSGEHIDHVVVLGGLNRGQNPTKIYHVQNAAPGKEWTPNRHAAPHCGQAGIDNPLTEIHPDSAYQCAVLSEFGQDAASAASAWSQDDYDSLPQCGTSDRYA